MNKELIGIKQVAQIMGVSDRTIQRMLADKELTKIKVRHRTLIRRQELEAYLGGTRHGS